LTGLAAPPVRLAWSLDGPSPELSVPASCHSFSEEILTQSPRPPNGGASLRLARTASQNWPGPLVARRASRLRAHLAAPSSVGSIRRAGVTGSGSYIASSARAHRFAGPATDAPGRDDHDARSGGRACGLVSARRVEDAVIRVPAHPQRWGGARPLAAVQL